MLVWGRDMIWRNRWVVNGEPITDRIGNQHSLKRLSKIDSDKALRLLRNRYYIMLTRAIEGTDIFFEDPETGKKVKSVLDYRFALKSPFLRSFRCKFIILGANN